jgi:hypothetical protein
MGQSDIGRFRVAQFGTGHVQCVAKCLHPRASSRYATKLLEFLQGRLTPVKGSNRGMRGVGGWHGAGE